MSFGYQVLGFGSGGEGLSYIEATGGTITTDGDYKINTFTADGTFTVTIGTEPTVGNLVEYIVVAGGGGGGNNFAGGGGGGGYRYNGAYDHTVTSQAYTITVGAKGVKLGNGGDSTFDGITSTGGGRGGYTGNPLTIGADGGSGGGGSGHNWPPPASLVGGIGNTPAIPAPAVQGYNGGTGIDNPPAHYPAGGGGGAAAVGATGGSAPTGSVGGTGAQNDISGSTLYYSPGGGGTRQGHSPHASGGEGGGGDLNGGDADNDNTPTTRGAGAGGAHSPSTGINNVAGVVAIRYKYQ